MAFQATFAAGKSRRGAGVPSDGLCDRRRGSRRHAGAPTAIVDRQGSGGGLNLWNSARLAVSNGTPGPQAARGALPRRYTTSSGVSNRENGSTRNFHGGERLTRGSHDRENDS